MNALNEQKIRCTDITRPVRCPICIQSREFRNTGVAITGSLIYICKKCSGYFLFPKVNVDYSDSGWTEKRLESWDKDIRRGRRFAQAISARIHEQWGCRIRNVLEIGCGSAFMGKGFESLGCSYTGIEVDTASVAFAQKEGLEVYCTPAEKIDDSPISDRKYDLVLSSNVFEHLENPYKAFQNLRVLASGLIIIIVPNAEGLFHRMKARRSFRKLIQWYQGNRREIAYSIDGFWHNIAYSAKTLEYLAEKASLELLDIEVIGINDRTFGFVQPNRKFLYRVASGFAALFGMDSEIMLVARAESAGSAQK